MWVPPKVHRDLLDERRRLDAEQLEMVAQAHEFKGLLDRFNHALKQIDPHLELVQAAENATTPGLKPGYYHVLRHNPTAPISFEVLEGPNGEFVEPGSNVFDLLERSDLWSDRTKSVRRERELQTQRSKERQREREHLERVAEFRERWKQANSDQILVKGVPWARS